MKSAGQASARETNRLKLAIKVSKTVTAIAICLSINSIATAVDWVRALQYQLESWSGAIAGGSLGTEVGSVMDGPVTAVFESITGSIFWGDRRGSSGELVLCWQFKKSGSRLPARFYYTVLHGSIVVFFILNHV